MESVPPVAVMSPTLKSVEDSLNVNVIVAVSDFKSAVTLLVKEIVGAAVSTSETVPLSIL